MRILYVNEQAASLFGCPKEDMLRKMITHVLHEWNEVRGKRNMNDLLTAGDGQYRLIVEAEGEGMFLLDKQFRFLYVNPRLFSVLGYEPEELIGRSCSVIIAPEEKEDHAREMALRKKGISGQYELQLIHKSGRHLWTHINSVPFMDDKGCFEGAFGMVTDITERKLAEDKLKESVSFLQATLESTADGILVVNTSGSVTGYNRQFAEMWQIPDSILQSKKDRFLLDFVNIQLKDPKKFIRSVEWLYSQPDAVSFDVLEFKDGRVFERYSQPQRLDGIPVGRVWSFRDITGQKHFEDELQHSREDLQKLTDHIIQGREEEKKAIAREIHDDIGQKLSVLKWNLSWLNTAVRPSPKARQKLKETREMIDETIASIHRIMKELYPPELDQLGLVESVEWLVSEIMNHSDLVFNTEYDCMPFQFPPATQLSIFRVVQEALTNILRHAMATTVNLSVKTVDDSLLIILRDNGRGITRRETESKDSYGLLGMKERIFLLNGTLKVKGGSGKGTTVEITVPLP
jgi:PAS domain S-box-containing protein